MAKHQWSREDYLKTMDLQRDDELSADTLFGRANIIRVKSDIEYEIKRIDSKSENTREKFSNWLFEDNDTSDDEDY